MDTVVLGVRVGLAAIFAVAAVGKLLDLPGSRRALEGFHVPPALVRPFSVMLPLAEASTAVALLVQPAARWGAVAALWLLAAFVLGIATAMARGEAPDCHCFGQISSSPAGWKTLARNALLAVPAALVVAHGPGTGIGRWIDTHSAAELVAVLTGAATLLLSAAVLRLWLQNRDLRSELSRAQAGLSAFPAGLPVGARAPRFSLPDLEGNVVSLEGLLALGKPVALMFVSPNCAPCQWMMPDLARWQTTLADRLTIALLATGGKADIRQLAEAHGLRNVLLQKEYEVYEAYLARATPSGVVVAPDGTIGSRTNSTGPILESLIRTVLNSDWSTPVAPAEPVGAGGGLAVRHWTSES